MSYLHRSLVVAFHGLSLGCVPAALSVMLIVAPGAKAQSMDTVVIHEALGLALPRRLTTVIQTTPLDPWITGARTDAPREGEALRRADGTEATWQRITSDANGWFTDEPPQERYVAVTIDRESPATMMLEAMGQDFALVNGVLRSGNPYQQKDFAEAWEPHFDYWSIPVDLRKGQNLLLFRYTRGRMKIRLVPATKAVAFNARDLTMPDAVTGQQLDGWGSILLANATSSALKGYSLVSMPEGGREETAKVPLVPPMGVRKIPFRIFIPARAEKGSVPLHLRLLGKGSAGRKAADTVTILVRIVSPADSRRETFISTIDGSVQYYAVLPPRSPVVSGRPALFLSLHGAGVEAINQAGSYYPKRWGYLVAPTNRRPYGFSWEDWGRLDALEVLNLAEKEFNIDEGRVYLTGHSMGGHGTWFMGATYPDKFAAIGPSAGWITFHTYRFVRAPEDSSPVKQMLRRSASSSNLFSLVDNYRHFGIYILHGEKDDNVPIQQSFMMIDHLKPMHQDYVFHEEPGAGHWWDNSPEPGADCVDWRPMFDFFARHVRPGIDRTLTVDFSTADPGISSRDGWLSIDAQERQLVVSSARLHLEPGLNRIQGATVNVARLSIDQKVLRADAPATVVLDSQQCAVRLDSPGADRLWFAKDRGKWQQVAPPPPSVKNARRCGTFKECFRNSVALVYGTAGSPEENRWAFHRARYDAEKLWYQGNASIDVLADTEFAPAKEPDRNVLLYGNSRTNRLWKTLLPDCPVKVDRGRLMLDDKSVARPDICCIFLRPRPGSDVASVGAVSGTGIKGFSLSALVRYLEPGLGLPDFTAFDGDVETQGDAGIILSGFFGPDWSMKSGEFVAGQ